jgi:hypothetical protein
LRSAPIPHSPKPSNGKVAGSGVAVVVAFTVLPEIAKKVLLSLMTVALSRPDVTGASDGQQWKDILRAKGT